MAKLPTAYIRLLVAFTVGAPALLAIAWVVQTGFFEAALALFFCLFVVIVLILMPRPGRTASGGLPSVIERLPAAPFRVVGAVCLVGSLSVMSSGITGRDIWSVVESCIGVVASAWAILFIGTKPVGKGTS